MSSLAIIALLGLSAFLPIFNNEDDDDELIVEDPAEPTSPTDPVEPITAVDPSEPITPEVGTADEPEDALLSATANLDETTNVITITTDPEETGTLYTVANRVDLVDGNGETNSVYETSVLLIPEGVDFADEVDTRFERGEGAYYYTLLSDIGATELGYWKFDPTAAQGDADAIPDYEYPPEANIEFVQIYSTNYGDGGQIDGIIDVETEDALFDNIEDNAYNTTISLAEDNGGAIITLPTDFTGTLAIFETTEDYFFADQLVRTEVTMKFTTLAEGTDFAASALTLANQTTETTTSAGVEYRITDGSLTEDEFLNEVPGASAFGLVYGVSTIEYDIDGDVLSEQIHRGVGVTSNIDTVRYVVRTIGEAAPLENGASAWSSVSGTNIVTSFGDAESIATDDGAVAAI